MNRNNFVPLLVTILIVLSAAILINYAQPGGGLGSANRPTSGLGSTHRPVPPLSAGPSAGIGSHFRPTGICYKPGNGPC